MKNYGIMCPKSPIHFRWRVLHLPCCGYSGSSQNRNFRQHLETPTLPGRKTWPDQGESQNDPWQLGPCCGGSSFPRQACRWRSVLWYWSLLHITSHFPILPHYGNLHQENLPWEISQLLLRKVWGKRGGRCENERGPDQTVLLQYPVC